MEKKGVRGNAVELGQATFGKAPEALDAVDVVLALSKLMSLVVHSEMLLIPHIDQSVIARPAVGMDDGFQADAAQNGLAQRLSATIRDDLGVDTAVALEDAKNDGLARSAATAFAPDAARAEVALIDFDFSGKGAVRFAPGGNPLAQLEVNTVDRTHGNTGDGGGFGRRQIEGESPN